MKIKYDNQIIPKSKTEKKAKELRKKNVTPKTWEKISNRWTIKNWR